MEQGGPDADLMGEWVPIIHRDIKLSNIFLGSRDKHEFCDYPTPKVADFGLARFTDDYGEIEVGHYDHAGVSEASSVG